MTTACTYKLSGFMAGLFLGIAVLPLTSAPGSAASLTNRDNQDHKVTIIEGEKRTDHVLKPMQALENICSGGCVARLNDSDDDEYQLEATDAVSIEDGYLYHDGDAPDQPQQGATPPGQTSPPAEKK